MIFAYPACTTDAHVVSTTLAGSRIVCHLELGEYVLFIDAVQVARIERWIVDSVRSPVMLAVGQDFSLVVPTALQLAIRWFPMVAGLHNAGSSFFTKGIYRCRRG